MTSAKTTSSSTQPQQQPQAPHTNQAPFPGTLQTQIDTAGLSQDLTASTSPTTPHGAADAARAMSSTEAWQPRLDRRQSWDSQEYKHEMQKQLQAIQDGEDTTGSGFSEQG